MGHGRGNLPCGNQSWTVSNETLCFFLQLNVEFICCDCPNVERFTVGILALVAQRERELISERTKAALAAARSRGVRLGTRTPTVKSPS
jgi:DNA invertase Pin-like site-specific DNA recombinase